MTQTETVRETKGDTDRDRDRDRWRHRQRQRERDTTKDREREREREKGAERESDLRDYTSPPDCTSTNDGLMFGGLNRSFFPMSKLDVSFIELFRAATILLYFVLIKQYLS